MRPVKVPDFLTGILIVCVPGFFSNLLPIFVQKRRHLLAGQASINAPRRKTYHPYQGLTRLYNVSVLGHVAKK